MLGTFLGMLAVALAMWLYQLQTRIQDQNESFIALARAVEQLGDSQRLAMDTLRQKIGGAKPEEFIQNYEKTIRERDEFQRTAREREIAHGGSGGPGQGTQEASRRARWQVRIREKELEKYENDAKDAPKLRDKIASLEESNQRKQRRLDELAPLIESEVGKAALELQHELSRTRYLAYMGWGFTAVFGLALVAAFFYYKPPTETAAETEPEPEGGERPTHRIV